MNDVLSQILGGAIASGISILLFAWRASKAGTRAQADIENRAESAKEAAARAHERLDGHDRELRRLSDAAARSEASYGYLAQTMGEVKQAIAGLRDELRERRV